MPAVDLLFGWALDASTPVDLTFGLGPTALDVVEVAIVLGPPGVVIEAQYLPGRDAVAVAVVLGPPAMTVAALYDNAVQRGPRCYAGGAWQSAADRPHQVRSQHRAAARLATRPRAAWGIGAPAGAAPVVAWEQLARAASPTAHWWSEAAARGAQLGGAWQQRTPARLAARARHQAGTGAGAGVEMGHQDRENRFLGVESRFGEATGAPRALRAPAGRALPRPMRRRARWQGARELPPGRSSTVLLPEPEGPQPCYLPGPGDPVALLFKATGAGTGLVFICERRIEPPAPIVVPVRRVYVVVNEIDLRRVDGDIPLNARTFALSIDADSWCWQFSAALPAESLPFVEPGEEGDPVELEALLNGTAYRVIVESIRRERSFGSIELQITGRGKAGLLDAPYAPVQNFANEEPRTVVQLMDDALTLAGVPIGWDIDSAIEDWLVPAGAWSHQGTHIGALLSIAQAAGAYILPAPAAQILHVVPRWPVAPWDWGGVDPDIELPLSVTQRESIEWLVRPEYNRVFVSGVGAGVLGRVTRAGSAGDLVAPMVTDPLITAAAAARQRGLAVLAEGGRSKPVALRLPVLPSTGVIHPGKFVRYGSGPGEVFGLVRSVSIEIDRPRVWQTIGVHTHVA